MTPTRILAIAVALPMLASAPSAFAQSATGGTGASGAGGPGTAGGAATSRSQIGVTSPAGVVNPNANGTGLGSTQPGSTQTFQDINRNAGNVGNSRPPTRCADTASRSTGAAAGRSGGEAAQALAQATGSRSAGRTPTTDVTGSITGNCPGQP